MKIREVAIRVGYTLLGALMTLCIVLIHDEYIAMDEPAIQMEEQSVEEEKVVSNIGITEESASLYDYEAEAEEKLAQLQIEAEKKKLEKAAAEVAEDIQEVEPAEEIAEETAQVAIETVSANSIEAAPVKWIKDYPAINSDKTLEEKLNERSSYEETLAVNAFDKKVIENSTIDFSDIKIAIMGDSLTLGSNLTEEEREKYSYPAVLQQILGCKEVVNLGIGGSTICGIGDDAMVDRYTDIPKDSDIVIIFGGTNDTLFENKWNYGFLEYEKRIKSDTFCGDLDKLADRVADRHQKDNEEKYCKLLFVNPPSCIASYNWYKVNPTNLLPQSAYAEAINVIAPSYGFEVIDMYNNNILNTHDYDVTKEFMPDGIHPNIEGYRIIAEHIASQIIQRIEQ